MEVNPFYPEKLKSNLIEATQSNNMAKSANFSFGEETGFDFRPKRVMIVHSFERFIDYPKRMNDLTDLIGKSRIPIILLADSIPGFLFERKTPVVDVMEFSVDSGIQVLSFFFMVSILETLLVRNSVKIHLKQEEQSKTSLVEELNGEAQVLMGKASQKEGLGEREVAHGENNRENILEMQKAMNAETFDSDFLEFPKKEGKPPRENLGNGEKESEKSFGEMDDWSSMRLEDGNIGVTSNGVVHSNCKSGVAGNSLEDDSKESVRFPDFQSEEGKVNKFWKNSDEEDTTGIEEHSLEDKMKRKKSPLGLESEKTKARPEMEEEKNEKKEKDSEENTQMEEEEENPFKIERSLEMLEENGKRSEDGEQMEEEKNTKEFGVEIKEMVMEEETFKGSSSQGENGQMKEKGSNEMALESIEKTKKRQEDHEESEKNSKEPLVIQAKKEGQRPKGMLSRLWSNYKKEMGLEEEHEEQFQSKGLSTKKEKPQDEESLPFRDPFEGKEMLGNLVKFSNGKFRVISFHPSSEDISEEHALKNPLVESRLTFSFNNSAEDSKNGKGNGNKQYEFPSQKSLKDSQSQKQISQSPPETPQKLPGHQFPMAPCESHRVGIPLDLGLENSQSTNGTIKLEDASIKMPAQPPRLQTSIEFGPDDDLWQLYSSSQGGFASVELVKTQIDFEYLFSVEEIEKVIETKFKEVKGLIKSAKTLDYRAIFTSLQFNFARETHENTQSHYEMDQDRSLLQEIKQTSIKNDYFHALSKFRKLQEVKPLFFWFSNLISLFPLNVFIHFLPFQCFLFASLSKRTEKQRAK